MARNLANKLVFNVATNLARYGKVWPYFWAGLARKLDRNVARNLAKFGQ